MRKINIITAIVFAVLILISGSCRKSFIEKPPATKKDVFEYMWKTLDERYTFFALKNIDWDSVHTVYSPKITNDMSDKAFFDTLSLMIDVLRDGHSGINSFFDEHKNVNFFFNSPENFNERLLTDTYFKGYGNRTGAFYHAAICDGKVGYIYYGSFSYGFTDADFEYILQLYSDADGLIIDVRNNFGGQVNNVYKIACHFTQTRVAVLGSRLKSGPGHHELTGITTTWLEPSGSYWNKPVCVLTNRKTYSAGSIFSIVMQELPNVTVVGDSTGGGLGLPIGSELPNGWQMHYAGSMILSPAGICHELGVPPDIETDMDPVAEENGIDSIIEKACDVILGR